MNIRHVEEKCDIRGTHRVNVEAWRAAYGDILPDSILDGRCVEPSEEQIEQRFARISAETGRFLVAVDETVAVRGYSYFRWGERTKAFVGEDEAGLKEIYVEPDYWNEGVGSRLLERGIGMLPEWTTSLEVETLSGNEIGKRFYEAQGFERVGTSEVEIGDDTYETTMYSLELD